MNRPVSIGRDWRARVTGPHGALALQFDRVVRAEQANLVALRAGQLAQPFLVGGAHLVVLRHQLLEDGQARRAVGRGLDLAVVEVGVTAVQQPAVLVAHGDRGVATGVADQRDHQDLGVDAGEHPDALKAEPRVAVHLVGLPLRAVGEVAARIAHPVAQARMNRGLVLRLERVDFGLREVWEPAGVVEVEVGAGDVPNVSGGEAEPAHVLERGVGCVFRRPERRRERDAERTVRIAQVADAHPGVDQHERVSGLDQQAVAHDSCAGPAALPADDLAAVWAQRPAVEVVDLRGHRRDPRTDRSRRLHQQLTCRRRRPTAVIGRGADRGVAS